jgi:hypothetical protein
MVEGRKVWLRDHLQLDPVGTRKNAEANVSQLEVIGAQNRLNALLWASPGRNEMVLKPGVTNGQYLEALRQYREAIGRYKRELKDYQQKHPIFFGLRANEQVDCPLLATVEQDAKT